VRRFEITPVRRQMLLALAAVVGVTQRVIAGRRSALA
jgi:hypothetical protein